MSARIIINEFAKMRHLHVVSLVVVLLLAVTGVGLYAATFNPDFDGETASSWNALMLGMGSGFTVASPLLLAILASRLVDAEHQGGGWLLSATSGVTPGGLCRAKLLALTFLITGVSVLVSALFAAVGFAVGIHSPWPAGRWAGLTLCLLVVNLALLALHLVLAARLENQLVGLGLGLLGAVIALVSSSLPIWVAHLSPWGYYSLSAASGYVEGQLLGFAPSYLSVLALGLAVAVIFLVSTRSFDRQEA